MTITAPSFTFNYPHRGRTSSSSTSTSILSFSTTINTSINAFSPANNSPPQTILTSSCMLCQCDDDFSLKKLSAAAAADKAIEYVSSGMVLGLGTGSTTALLVTKLGQLLAEGKLTNILCVPTSKPTHDQALSLNIPLATLDTHPCLDLVIDGADEVDPDLNLLKGRRGAFLREKMVAAASDQFLVLVDDSKLVSRLGDTGLAMPVEVAQFCWSYNKQRLEELFKEEGCEGKLRVDGINGKAYVTENWNYIVDLYLKTPLKDSRAAGMEITALEGVVEHGLFLDMTSAVIIAGKDGVVNVKSKWCLFSSCNLYTTT